MNQHCYVQSFPALKFKLHYDCVKTKFPPNNMITTTCQKQHCNAIAGAVFSKKNLIFVQIPMRVDILRRQAIYQTDNNNIKYPLISA